jgi:hypothetical protein
MLGLRPFAIVFCVFVLASPTRTVAQSALYQWFTLGINGRISSKWSVSFSRQYSRKDEQDAPFDYYLDDFRLRRKLGNQWEILAGVSYLVSDPGSEESSTKRRYSLGLVWQTKLIGDLRFSSRLFAERHLQERRYDGRIIGASRLDYNGLDLFKSIRVRPFVAGQLFYFIGGGWIKQYDREGTFVRRSPTYGLHRSRLRLGLDISPCSWLQLSGFYTIQNEFNSRHAVLYHHQINEVDPATGKITRPFANFRAWGAGLTFLIGSRKKNSGKSKMLDTEVE